MHLRPLLFVLLLVSCGDKDPVDSGPTDSPADSAPTEVEAATHRTMSGVVTWTWDFDEEAEGNGYVDCSYTRNYVGREDSALPWYCVDCEEMWFMQPVLEPGGEDCLYQVAYTTTALPEWMGFQGEQFYRGSAVYLAPLQPLADALVIDGDTLTWTGAAEGELGDVGGFSRETEGSLELSRAEGGTLHELTPPDTYGCGWPKADPPAYEGDYVMRRGETLPDGVFRDQCDEPVRLHDFKGRYVLLITGAPDCPPCVEAAEGLAGIEEQLADSGVELVVIELMSASVSASLDTPDQAQLQAWVDAHGLSSPVLADRTYGWQVVNENSGATGIPNFILVDPELTVLDWSTGYGSDTRFSITTAIINDAGG